MYRYNTLYIKYQILRILRILLRKFKDFIKAAYKI